MESHYDCFTSDWMGRQCVQNFRENHTGQRKEKEKLTSLSLFYLPRQIQCSDWKVHGLEMEGNV